MAKLFDISFQTTHYMFSLQIGAFQIMNLALQASMN